MVTLTLPLSPWISVTEDFMWNLTCCSSNIWKQRRSSLWLINKTSTSNFKECMKARHCFLDCSRHCVLLACTFFQSLVQGFSHRGKSQCQPQSHWPLCSPSRTPPPYLKNTIIFVKRTYDEKDYDSLCNNSVITDEGGAHDDNSATLRGRVDVSGIIGTLK